MVGSMRHLSPRHPRAPYPRQVFSLSDQIQHKSDLLRQHFSQEGQPPLALLAHSIGAYMAIKAAAGAADARIHAVVAMYPFLEHDPACPRQRSLAWLSRRWRWVGRLVAPLQLLPHPWLRWEGGKEGRGEGARARGPVGPVRLSKTPRCDGEGTAAGSGAPGAAVWGLAEP